MKFLLVDPPHKIWEFLRAWVPSPACLQLAAYVERDFDIEFMDCTIMENPWGDLEEKVKRLRPDVVGLSTACTYFVYDTMNAAMLVKEASPESVVIAGGAHPSLTPEQTLRECKAIDYICVGEGEITLHEFLAAIEKKEDISKVKGLAFLDENNSFVYTGERPLIEDLDTLPMPAYHLYNMDHPYIGLPSEGKRSFVVNFARGCPYDCSFCSESVFWRRRWRSRSPARIGEECELLKEKYDRTLFYVGDNRSYFLVGVTIYYPVRLVGTIYKNPAGDEQLSDRVVCVVVFYVFWYYFNEIVKNLRKISNRSVFSIFF